MSWWDLIFKKPEKIKFYISDNPDPIEGNLYRGTRLDEGLLDCHGSLGNISPIASSSHIKSFNIVKGYPALLLNYDDPLSILNDVEEVLTASKALKLLCGVQKVNLIGESRGGYVALMTMAFYPQFFNKCVSFIPPIDMEHYDWTVWEAGHQGEIDEAKAYFGASPSPMARWEEYVPMKDKILVIGGGRDMICPVKTHTIPFSQKVGCKYYVVASAGHNAHQTTEGRSKCVDFLGGKS